MDIIIKGYPNLHLTMILKYKSLHQINPVFKELEVIKLVLYR